MNTPIPDPDDALILDSIDRFLERDVRPVVRELEANDIYPQKIVDQLVELGLFGATIAPEYGGLGLSAETYAKIIERISAVWMSVSGFFNSHLIMAAAVQRFGRDEQKQQFLPRFASGELRGGIALTEPDCGTDLQAIRTRAVKDGEEYVVNGTKTWITNSSAGGILAVLVKTDVNTQPPHRGMSLLLVEKGPGFTVTRKLDKLGYRGIDTAELVFEDCRVPVTQKVEDFSRSGPGWSSGGSILRPAVSASPESAWRNPLPMRSTDKVSANRLASISLFRSSWRIWRHGLNQRVY